MATNQSDNTKSNLKSSHTPVDSFYPSEIFVDPSRYGTPASFRIYTADGEIAANGDAPRLILAEEVAHRFNGYLVLLNLLREAHAAMQNYCDENDGHDPFGMCCGNCDGAIPVPHSLGCRMAAAISKAEQGGQQ